MVVLTLTLKLSPSSTHSKRDVYPGLDIPFSHLNPVYAVALVFEPIFYLLSTSELEDLYSFIIPWIGWT